MNVGSRFSACKNLYFLFNHIVRYLPRGRLLTYRIVTGVYVLCTRTSQDLAAPSPFIAYKFRMTLLAGMTGLSTVLSLVSDEVVGSAALL
jgi:hypothetical protein